MAHTFGAMLTSSSNHHSQNQPYIIPPAQVWLRLPYPNPSLLKGRGGFAKIKLSR
jgi:hypothetical protein